MSRSKGPKKIKSTNDPDPDRYHVLFDTIKHGIIYWSSDLRVVQANKASGEILGVSIDDLIGRTPDDFGWKAVREDGTPLPGMEFPSMIAFKTKEEVIGTVIGIHNPVVDRIIWVKANAIPLFHGEESEPFEVYSVFEDITEKRKTEKALKESEERFRRMANNVNDVFWTMDLNLDFTYVSPSIERFTGFTSEELLRTGLSGMITRGFVENVLNLISKTLEDESKGEFPIDGSRRIEFKMPCKDGGDVWAEADASFLRDDDGKPVGIMGLTRDISERKEYETALRKEEERYRDLFNSAGDAIMIAKVTKEGPKFIACNKKAEEMFKVQPGGFVDLDPTVFSPPIQPDGTDSITVISANVAKAMKGRTVTTQWIHRRSDGKDFPCEVTLSRIDLEEQPVIQAIVRDITKRRKAEDELRKNEEWYRTLIEISPDPILIYDLSGNIQFASDQAKEMYGVDTVGELLSEVKNIGDLMSDVDRKNAFENLKVTLSEGRSERNKYTIKVKDGSKYLIEVNSSVLSDPNGKPISFISIIRDITEQNKTREQIEFERNRAEFYMDLLSHDIGNLHQGLLAWTTILKARSNDESERIRGLAKLEELEKRSIKLVRNVLLLSRLKDMGADLSPINLLPLIKKTVKDIKSLFGDREMDITISSDLKRAEVMAESVLEEVFFNLLHNGIKFQYEDPVMIEIDVSENKGPEGDSLFVSFADHGIGVSDEKKDKLFDRHIKGSDYVYSGIGLSLVKELVSRYGGRLEVEDRVPGDYSKGAKFVIHFPLLK